MSPGLIRLLIKKTERILELEIALAEAQDRIAELEALGDPPKRERDTEAELAAERDPVDGVPV